MSTQNLIDLSGRIAVVTGAGGGIGQAIALTLAHAGARVAVLDLNFDSVQQTATLINTAGLTAMAFACDITKLDSVANASGSVQATFGAPDVLVNNAGVLRPGPLSSLSVEEWNAVLAVDLTGYFIAAQVFGKAMRAKCRGSIVHIGSIAAKHPQTQGGAYSVAKAGVSMLSSQIAVEWGAEGVRSNVIHPGMIRTPMTADFYRQPGLEARRVAMIPNGRIGEPEDIARAVAYLASDASAYVTGAEILVDGGFNSMLMDLLPRPGFDKAEAVT